MNDDGIEGDGADIYTFSNQHEDSERDSLIMCLVKKVVQNVWRWLSFEASKKRVVRWRKVSSRKCLGMYGETVVQSF